MFAAALVVHVLSGLTAVVAGVLACAARKEPGRHPPAGRVYLWSLTAVFGTATVMAAIRWQEDAHLFGIAAAAWGLGLLGWQAHRRLRPGWPRWHAIGMGGSFIGLFTGFYVDNGPRLPVWRLLPHWTYWVIPAAVGIPLTWFALRRYEGRVTTPAPAFEPLAGPPRPPR